MSRFTSASIQSFISSSFMAGSRWSAGVSCQTFTAPAMAPEPFGGDGATDRHPLVHERRERHPPPVARIAESLGVGDAHVGEVHLVELGFAGHLAQRTHLDAGRLHVDDARGEARVLGHLGVGAEHEQPPPG